MDGIAESEFDRLGSDVGVSIDAGENVTEGAALGYGLPLDSAAGTSLGYGLLLGSSVASTLGNGLRLGSDVLVAAMLGNGLLLGIDAAAEGDSLHIDGFVGGTGLSL